MRTGVFVFILLALLGGGTSVLGAEAKQAYHERTSILLLAAHCQSLGKLEHAALASGQSQARGALLRAGTDPETLDALQMDLARRAKLVSCDREDVQTEIARMREAAQIWVRMYTMQFPSRWQNWEARRDDARDKPRWRVRVPLSTDHDSIMDFGLVATGEEVFLDFVVLGGRAPSSVILHMRDVRKLAAPLDTGMLRLMGRTGGSPASLMPPRSVVQSFFAIDKMQAPASLTGEVKKNSRSILFRFSEKALSAFTALDPRDVVALELIYPARAGKRQKRERIYVEAGDFTAARIFAQTFPKEKEQADVPVTN